MTTRQNMHLIPRRSPIRRFAPLSRWAVAAGFLALGGALPAVWARDEREDAAVAYRRDLERMGEECERKRMPTAARTTRQWILPPVPTRHRIYLPETAPRLPAPPSEEREGWDAWRSEFLSLRRRFAAQLFAEARACVTSSPARAYRLLHEVLFHDPDHRDAARILGRTGSPRRIPRHVPIRVTRPSVREPITGWPPRKYSRVTTPHFSITTNASRQAARRLADELERLYRVWQQQFFSYWTDGRWLADRFAGRDRSPPVIPRHQIIFVRTREDYEQLLHDAGTALRSSLGYYSPRKRACLFVAAQALPRTWYHEATHQLFQEMESAVAAPGESSDAWAIEGIALYMESLQFHPGFAMLGGWDARRLQFARYRRLRNGFHLPLESLAALGRSPLQQHPDLPKLYSQAAGLAHFFLDSGSPQRADGFLHYVQRIYVGRNDATTLERSCGAPPAELDQHYREFLRVDDETIRQAPPRADLGELSLGMTRVTADGVRRLDHLKQLEWLDLGGLPIASDDLAWLSHNRSLRQLMLERTRVDDSLGPTLQPLRNLEELDLSHTRVTNRILSTIAALPRIESLWLSGTTIDDEGLATLRRLKRLRRLDVEETRVSAAALERLRRRLPQLTDVSGP